MFSCVNPSFFLQWHHCTGCATQRCRNHTNSKYCVKVLWSSPSPCTRYRPRNLRTFSSTDGAATGVHLTKTLTKALVRRYEKGRIQRDFAVACVALTRKMALRMIWAQLNMFYSCTCVINPRERRGASVLYGSRTGASESAESIRTCW